MLFQVVTKMNPVGISADEYMKRLPEGVAYMRNLMQQGIIEHSWVRIGESGALNIFNVSSHEQLLKSLYENPLSPHLAFLITPLVPADVFDDENVTSFVHEAASGETVSLEEK